MHAHIEDHCRMSNAEALAKVWSIKPDDFRNCTNQAIGKVIGYVNGVRVLYNSERDSYIYEVTTNA